MSKQIVANVFQIISLIFYIFTLIPQVLLNYRLKNTSNLSLITVCLWIIGAEVSLFYLIWTKQLIFISISYGIFTLTAIFIVCQMKFYEKRNEKRKFKKYFEFLGNYLLLLISSLINGFAFYYIFELSREHQWISQTIGIVIPSLIDGIGFIPQIIKIVQMKSSYGYSLLFILSDLFSSTMGLISVCLQDKIDIVPLISFISLIVFQSILFVLKLFVYPREKTISSELFDNDQNENPSGGLIYVSNRYQREKSIPYRNGEQSLDEHLSEDLKDIFRKKFNFIDVKSDQSDQLIIKFDLFVVCFFFKLNSFLLFFF